MCHFRQFLEGRLFTILTDHKPLTHAFRSASSRYSPQEIRHLAYLAEFCADIQHVPETANSPAYALSRIASVSPIVQPLTPDAIAAAQATGDERLQLHRRGTSSLRFTDLPIHGSHLTICCDSTRAKPRPFVTAPYRCTAFAAVHNRAHTGICATQRMVTARFVWPSINPDVRAWARSCNPCQRSKVHRHTKLPHQQFGLPYSRFDLVHIVIIGPLPPSSGFRYLFKAVDRCTRWPEACPMPDMSAETVAAMFIATWVARFRIPSQVTTDRVRQFERNLFSAFARLLGTSRIRTLHPMVSWSIFTAT
ncbi:uncharacterized protein LOC135400429 [Ornithodoros turicata]|uniref:uncharacterized protein LOC135400429 n=1 Tax=Ornithodoros turicata TaxID=34597 RepID=UPI003138B12D